jgi:hypothetical protein
LTELFGKTDLNASEHADSVEFTVMQTNGTVAVFIGPVITASVVWLFWRQGRQATKIMAVLAAVSCAIAINCKLATGEFGFAQSHRR